MRKLLLLTVVLACARGEDAQPDSMAAAMPATPALTAADVSGTWAGASMAEGSDSVSGRWTIVSTSGTEGKYIPEGSTDTVTFTTTFDADSMVATSAAFSNPRFGSAPVMFTSIGRLAGDRLVGHASIVLASKPDSLISTTRWEATRVP